MSILISSALGVLLKPETTKTKWELWSQVCISNTSNHGSLLFLFIDKYVHKAQVKDNKMPKPDAFKTMIDMEWVNSRYLDRLPPTCKKWPNPIKCRGKIYCCPDDSKLIDYTHFQKQFVKPYHWDSIKAQTNTFCNSITLTFLSYLWLLNLGCVPLMSWSLFHVLEKLHNAGQSSLYHGYKHWCQPYY